MSLIKEKSDNIKLLIFDLDGTLADTIESIREGVNIVMERHGFPKRSYEEIRLAIGNGARELIRRSLPSDVAVDASLVDKYLKEYDEAYGWVYDHCDSCYDGMYETVRELKKRGYTLSVLSNKQDAYVKALVKNLFPDREFSIVMGQSDLPKKPDPTVPFMIAGELGFKAENAAFVGDSDVDVVTAKNAGMISVGCAWGYRGGAILKDKGADFVIEEPRKLLEIFS